MTRIIKSLGMSSRVCATGHIKDPVPLVEKSRALCPGGRHSHLYMTVVFLVLSLFRLPRRRHRHPPASDEKRLTKYLLYNYQKVGRGGRPVSNSTAPILVKFGLAMIQMDLDEKENVLSSSVWCRYVSYL